MGNWKNQGKAGTITATSSGVTVSTTEFVVKDDELPVNQYPEFARTMEVTKGSFEFSENTSLGIAKDAATADVNMTVTSFFFIMSSYYLSIEKVQKKHSTGME